jgi:hypothetical protein
LARCICVFVVGCGGGGRGGVFLLNFVKKRGVGGC